MGKYSNLKAEILKRYFDTKDSSDQIAQDYAGDVDNVGSLGRTIRKWIRESEQQREIKPAKILMFDIETAPMICYAWSKYQTPISDQQIIQDWFIISWSAKWLFDDTMISRSVTPEEILKGDDKRIVMDLWELLDEADIVVAHNLKSFDKKKAQTRFLKYRMGLPSQYLEVDTLLTARRQFKISSNRLDYLAKFFGLEGKIQTETGLWERCMKGEKEAIEFMVEYCEQDVRVLEDVYLELLPYTTNHPNLGLFSTSETPICKGCGHDRLVSDGVYRTTANIYEALRCKKCGLQHRVRNPITPKNIKENLLR